MRHADDQPTSFLTLEQGTPVVDRFGRLDAPEVRRISGGAVTLGTTLDEVVSPASHAKRVHGVPAARYGRDEVTEADRDAVIDALKAAYVRGELSTEALGERVALAHLAETLDELDEALADLVHR